MTQPPNRRQGGEFSEQLGDVQRQGSPNVTGVLPLPHNAPVGLAPPSPLQVQSVFDTRPIAGFDFAYDGFAQMGNENPQLVASARVPNGYTAVLRRVEFEFVPPIAMAVSQVGGGGPPFMQFFLTRDNGVIPENVVRFRGVSADYTWHTHQVFGMNALMGVRGNFVPGGAVPIDDPTSIGGGIDMTVRFFGVLIPSKSLPPTEEVGSDPVLVRDYVKMQKGTE